MRNILKMKLAILSLLVVLLPIVAPAVASATDLAIVEADRQALLDQQLYLVWQRINEARQNPRAVLDRLGISAEQARTALGADAWIIEEGLPPLALDDRLIAAAAQHGRDMLARVYYSHVSPEGLGPAERIAAAGYEAVRGEETLAALVFSSYVELAPAVDFMIDTMLRDELVATPGVSRNIFSPEFSALGPVFFAETIPLLEGQPYVYLFVLDFAKPLVPERYLIGTYDAATDWRPLMMPFATGQWDFQPVLHPGLFQVPYPDGGAALVLVDEVANKISAPVFVYDERQARHRFVDLRGLR